MKAICESFLPQTIPNIQYNVIEIFGEILISHTLYNVCMVVMITVARITVSTGSCDAGSTL